LTILDAIRYSQILKAKRKRANAYQLDVLNRVFEKTFFPSTEVRAELGKQLGMSPRTVQIWFQNKRQSIRTRQRVAVEQQQQYSTTKYI
jgi:transcriptional regulator with XRE-family HTH domain